jgi:osmotically-inducible protein OsmY
MTIGVPEAISPDEAEVRLDATRTVLRKSIPPADLRLDQLAFQTDGALLMEGEAASLAVKKRALRLAIVASGARGIVDRLHLPSGVPLTDGEIRSQLLDRFALDPRFKDVAIFEDRDPSPLAERLSAVAGAAADFRGRITIEVRDGVITLNGRVPSLLRKRLAGVLAWRQPGVRDVVNGLAVEPPEEDGSDRVEAAVREALDGHPLFDDRQIRVGVFKDIVRLTGLVHSEDARQAAEEEAWRVLGVEEVVNEIQTSR